MSLAYLSPIATFGRLAGSRRVALGLIAAIHLAALGIIGWTEYSVLPLLLSSLAWASLNFIFLALLRRPGVAAALSFGLVGLVVLLSQLKFSILWMVINFFDVLIINSDTMAFMLSIFPDLRIIVLVAVLIAAPLLIMIWRIDLFRVPRAISLLGATAGVVAITGLSLAFPEEPWEQFQGVNHISTFVRSGVTTAYELSTKGWIDFDSTTSDQLRAAAHESCHPSVKPPNIVMVLDEASFDASAVPGIKLPPGYGGHFQSWDGKKRSLIVEGSGGPTWYTEYNVLTGLSARSYGRLSYYVTRIAAGRVNRGLPQALKRCGYKTISLYPAYGAFLSAKKFQETAGVSRFLDSADMKAGDFETDRFYYDQALQIIQSENGDQPLFIFVYTMFNHFPWWNILRPELTPDWRSTGNDPQVDEYLRRQWLSERDYTDFRQKLAAGFPREFVPAGSLRRSSAGNGENHRSRRHRGGGFAADHGARPALLHDLLRASIRSTSSRRMCPRRSTGWKRPISRWWFRRRPGFRSTPRLQNKRKSWSAATGCFFNARAAPRPGVSTAC